MDSNNKPNLDPDFLNEMKEFAKILNQISIDAVHSYKPLVDQIINSNSKDVNQIEWTLDLMLEFCSNDEMLVLYKKLCRHLYFINQASAFAYVNYYRERWDEESFNNE